MVLSTLVTLLLITTVAGHRHKHHNNYRFTSRSVVDDAEDDLYAKKMALEKRGMELPDLSSLLASLGSETKTGTQYEFGGCVIEIAKDQCKITFLPKKESCHDQLSLGKLFDRFFPKGSLKTLFKEYVPLGVFQIERFVLDKCIGDLEFESLAKEAFNIIKEKLKVKKGKLNLSFNYKEFLEAPSFDKLGMDIRGEIELMDKTMPITLNKKRDSAEGLFSLKVDSLKASDFASLFSKKEVKDSSSPAEASMFTDAVIEDPLITGSRDVDGGFEFIVKGHVTGINGLGRITLFVIAQKQVDEPTSVAIVADIKDVKPTALLSSITGKDLTSIPIIKDITANLAIEFANHDILMLKDPEINKVLSKYIANAKTISVGTKIKIELPIKKILTNINTASSLSHVPDLLYIQMFLHDGKVCFKFPDNVAMDILNILTALLPKIPDILFTKILKTPPRVIIKKFDVNIATKYVDMMLVAPGDVVLGSNLIKVRDAKFQLKHEINGPWDFKIDATKVVGNSTLDISVATEGSKYIFTGKIDSLTTKSLAEHFGSKESANGILSKMDFLNFGLKDLSISAVFGERLVFRIKGNPVLFNFEGTFFEGFIIDTDNGRKMAFGIVMKNIRIDEIVYKLFNKKILQCSWMSDLTASFTVSNTDPNKQLDFTLPDLKKLIKLKKGVYFNTVLTIPEDCKGETLCEIVKEKMKPGTKLYVEGELSTTGFELRAGYKGNGLAFSKDIVLSGASLVVSVGVNNEFYVEGEVKMKEPPVTFRAKLGVGITGKVELSLIMEGMWKRPFSLSYIAFGNMMLGVGIQPGVPIPQLEFSAEMHFGKIGNSKEIIVKTAIGFSPINPASFYFYGNINRLTLGSIAEAFEFNIALPKVILDTGFPDGLVVGFTLNPKGKSIPHLNVNLKTGFMLKGSIYILGFYLKCDILINFPKAIRLAVEMSPINIGGGLIKLTKSASDLENGPKLLVAVSSQEVAVKIMAYAELVGIGAEVQIDISDKGLKFYLYGNLFNLIEANITVSAPYGNGILEKSQFSIASCVSASISDIQTEAVEVIDEAAKDTDKVLSKAHTEIEKAASWHQSASSKLEKWANKMSEKDASIQRKSRKLDNIKEYLDEDCVDKCDDVCLAGPSIKKNCKKILGRWISCPEWDDCKYKMENPACLAKCKGKKIYLEGKAIKKRVTMEILSDAIAIIKKILQMAKQFVDKSKGLIDFAQRAAQKVEFAAHAGKEALIAIAKYTKEKLINIHHICFNTTLEKAESACFGVNVDVTLFGNKRFTHQAEVCFDVSFIKNLAAAISNKIFPGITAVKEKIMGVKDYFKEANHKREELKEMEEENEVEEKDLEGKLESQKLEDDDDEDAEKNDLEDLEGKDDIPVMGETHQKKKEKVHAVPNHSRSERYIKHQIYGDFPSVSIQDDLTLDAFETRSPWSFSRNDSPFTTKNEVKINEEEISDQVLKGDVPLELDNLEDPDDTSKCGQTTSVINTYSMISDTLALIEQKLSEEKHMYKTDAQRFQKEIADTEKYILSKCKRGNISEERTDDALFYVSKLKTGIQQWMEDVNKQINLQDEESLNMWRKSFADIIKTNKGIDLQKFLEILDQASKETSKRHTIPHGNAKFGDSINSASKIIHDLLTGPSGSLSLKRTSIDKLQNDITFMRNEIPCAA